MSTRNLFVLHFCDDCRHLRAVHQARVSSKVERLLIRQETYGINTRHAHKKVGANQLSGTQFGRFKSADKGQLERTLVLKTRGIGVVPDCPTRFLKRKIKRDVAHW